MEQLRKIASIKPKSSSEIKYSKIGLGFEKLDRDIFDPHKAYDKVAACGVKWARIQSGWERTEKERGVYDFAWLDDIVDNFIKRGIEPWMCLCYGNPLYTEAAKTVFGSVGCPPIFSEEEKAAWANYVRVLVARYRSRVNYFEIWNEPDWCWTPKENPTELGLFTIDTAKVIRETAPEAKIIGGVITWRPLAYINTAFKTGMAEYLDFLSFHEYTHDERQVFERVETLRALAKSYNPKIELIQGESGSQSRSGGHGALCGGAWSESIQAKQLARHTIADLITDVHFTSYFSCMDMIEALDGVVGQVDTYLDYGYFGVIGADFDENGRSTGAYTPKKSYYVLQNICSIFAEKADVISLPIFVHQNRSERLYDIQPARYEISSGAFRKDGGDAFVYWYPSNIMTTDFRSSITLEFYSSYDKINLVDVMDGSIYEIPDKMIEDKGDGVRIIKELPIKDTPLVLTFGEFI